MSISTACISTYCNSEKAHVRRIFDKHKKSILVLLGFESIVEYELSSQISLPNVETDNSELFDFSFTDNCSLCVARNEAFYKKLSEHRKYICDLRKLSSRDDVQVYPYQEFNPIPDHVPDNNGSDYGSDLPEQILPILKERFSEKILQEISPEILLNLPTSLDMKQNLGYAPNNSIAELPKSMLKNSVSHYLDSVLQNSLHGSLSKRVSDTDCSSQEPLCKASKKEEMSVSQVVKLTAAEVLTPQKRPYTYDDLQNALKDVCDGKMGTRRASIVYGVPRSTIRNHLNKIKLNKANLEQISETSSKRKSDEPAAVNFLEEVSLQNAISITDSTIQPSEKFIRSVFQKHLQSNSSDVSTVEREAPITEKEQQVKLRCALAAVQFNGMSVSKASAVFGVQSDLINEKYISNRFLEDVDFYRKLSLVSNSISDSLSKFSSQPLPVLY